MNDSDILGLFSPTYAVARRKFLQTAAARGLAVDSRVLDLAGAEGEALAIDVVLDGPADALVTRLRRIQYGPFKLEDLPSGAWREIPIEDVRKALRQS